LPFYADYAINVTSPTSGTLWAWTGAAWQEDTGTDWEFAQGDGGDTEIRLVLPMSGISGFQLIAFALDDDVSPGPSSPPTTRCPESGPKDICGVLA
jgi:hypothetical protein